MMSPAPTTGWIQLDAAIDYQPLTVSPDLPLPAVLERMRSHQCSLSGDDPVAPSRLSHPSSYALVTEGRTLRGIFTERDLIRLVAQRFDFTDRPIGDCLTPQSLVTCRQSELTDCFRILDVLRQHRIHHLPVVTEQDQLVGIITAENLRRLVQPVHLLRLRQVREVMRSRVVQAIPSTPIQVVAELMAEQHVSCVVIVGAGAPPTQPIGIVTQRDILQFQALRMDFEQVIAQSVMSRPLMTLAPDDSLWTAHAAMQRHLLRRMVVTGGLGELVGIVTLGDVLQSISPMELYRVVDNLQQELAVANSALQQETAQRQHQELLFTKVFQNSPDPIALLSFPAGQFVEVNERYAELVGHERAALVEAAQTITGLGIWAATDWAKLCTQLAANSRIENWEQPLETAMGDRRVALCAAERLTLHDQPHVLLTCKDITAQQQAQQLVTASEARFRLALQHVPDVCVLYDRERRFLYVNERAEALTGWPQIHFIGKRDEDLFPPEVTDQYLPLLRQAIATGQLQTGERTIQLPGQTPSTILIKYAPILDAAGQVQQVLGMTIDITAQRQAEQSLNRQTQLLEQVHDAVIAVDRGLRVTYLNPQAAALYGISAQDAIGHHLSALYDYEWLQPEDESTAWHSLETTGRWQGENCHRLPDGRTLWVESTVSMLNAVDGETIGLIAVIRDISDRKRVNTLLQQQYEFIQQLTDNAPQLLYIFDLEQQSNVYVNRQVENLLGYTRAEIAAGGAALIQTLWHPDDRPQVQSAFAQMLELADGEFLVCEYRMRHKDGSWVWFQSRDTVYERNAVGVPIKVLGIAVEIGDRKQAEQALTQYHEREQVLSQVAELIRSSLELEQIFEVATAEVGRCMAADQVGIVQYLPTQQLWRHVAEYRQEPTVRSWLDLMIPDAGNPIGEQMKQRETVCIHSDDVTGNATNQAIAAEFPGFWLVTPLVIDDTVWGALSLRRLTANRAWQADEVAMVQRLATKLAIAIQQAQLYQQIQTDLQEKNVLLSEVHHRVKNNLQIVTSLLQLQRLRVTDLESEMALSEVSDRVYAMAMVHESLYSHQNFAAINFSNYLRRLAERLLQAYQRPTVSTHLDIQVPVDITVPLDQAMPCGLILNELVTNAIKYGITADQTCTVHIWLECESTHLRLTVGNTGDTLPADFALDVNWEQSMGLSLVAGLTEQLAGTLTLLRAGLSPTEKARDRAQPPPSRTLFCITLPRSRSVDNGPNSAVQ